MHPSAHSYILLRTVCSCQNACRKLALSQAVSDEDVKVSLEEWDARNPTPRGSNGASASHTYNGSSSNGTRESLHNGASPSGVGVSGVVASNGAVFRSGTSERISANNGATRWGYLDLEFNAALQCQGVHRSNPYVFSKLWIIIPRLKCMQLTSRSRQSTLLWFTKDIEGRMSLRRRGRQKSK